jgi:signal transduction histidine kinase
LNLPRSSIAEFRDLSTAITQLVQQNHKAYKNQREFTENASHEMQTPLAICRTKLELLAQSKDLSQDQAELIGQLFDGMDRITRLNKNLLLLARIENRQFFDTEEINLSGAVQKSVHAYHRQASEKSLQVTQNVDQDSFIKFNPILLEVLINNLVSNAIRHTPESGTVDIVGSREFILVTNSGPPLEHPEKIFQRFHRESRSTLGSGLGLSIVKKVCDVSGCRIAYRYTSSGHQFQIWF